jgi:hypothetical protein
VIQLEEVSISKIDCCWFDSSQGYKSWCLKSISLEQKNESLKVLAKKQNTSKNSSSDLTPKERVQINSRKVERPSKEELQKLIWEIPTIHIAKKFGVSDKAIEKWCKAYKIDKPPRGYWTKLKRNKSIISGSH